SKSKRSLVIRRDQLCNIPNAAEADVRSRAIRRVRGTRGYTIPIAVRLVTQIRAAFHHLGGAFRRSDGIRARGGEVIGGMEPVTAPLPGVASNRVEAVAVRWVGVHGSGSGVAVLSRIDLREIALPDVAEMAATGSELVAPGV